MELEEEHPTSEKDEGDDRKDPELYPPASVLRRHVADIAVLWTTPTGYDDEADGGGEDGSEREAGYGGHGERAVRRSRNFNRMLSLRHDTMGGLTRLRVQLQEGTRESVLASPSSHGSPRYHDEATH